MRNEIKITILLFFLTCLFFWKIVINPGYMLYPAQDVMEQYSYWKFLISTTFQKYGELPLWNPGYYSGHPFVSNLLSAMYYPINIVYLFFNPDLAFNYVFLFDIFLAGLFTFLFLRELGLDDISSLFSSLTFIFSGYFADHIFAGHLANIDAIIWTPLIFLLTELIIKKGKIIYVFLLSIALALQVLAGHIQHSFYSNIGLIIYFLVRNIQIFSKERNIKTNIKIFSLFALSGLVFILLSSVQILPSFEFLFYSVRNNGLNFESASLFSLPPYQLVGFLAPEFFGSPLNQSYWGGRNFIELTAYIGISSFLMSLVSVLFKRSNYVISFVFVILFCLFFSFGKYTPFYYFFYKYIPGFNLFRIPSTPLFVYVFSMAVLSGFGFSFLFSKFSKGKKLKFIKFLKILFLALFLLILITIFVYFQKQTLISIGEKIILKKYTIGSETNTLQSLDYYKSKIPQAYFYIFYSLCLLSLFLFFSILLMYLRISNKLPANLLKILFILLLLIDLWVFWQKYILIIKPEEIYEKPKIKEVDISDIISIIKRDNDRFRVYDFSNWIIPQHITIRNDIELINGYDLSEIGLYEDFIEKMIKCNYPENTTCPSIGLSLLNGKYLISQEKLKNKNLELVYYTNRTIKMMPRSFIAASKYESNQTYIYKNSKFLPRAYIVPNVEVIENKQDVLAKLTSKNFNPKETILFEQNPQKPLNNKVQFQKINITFYSPNRLILEVNVTDSGYLFLSEIWYPDWEAYDNGKKVEIFRANYIFRSIYLDGKGYHKIEFVYRPRMLKIGIFISSVTLFVVFAILLYKIIRK